METDSNIQICLPWIGGLSLARFLGTGSMFWFGFNLARIVDSTWPSVSFDLRSLILESQFGTLPSNAKHDLGQIFHALTLPQLEDFSLFPVWHPEQFLSLSRRSFFHTHLTSLLNSAIATDDELLQCLAELTLLRTLFITEPSIHTTITDTLLRALTWGSDSEPPVSELRFLTLNCHLQFSDDVYGDLLSSRLGPGRSGPFDAKLRSLCPSDRKLSPDLAPTGQMSFSSALS
ncbi:hypothetical protein B0H19DRAFT_1072922 [Mycena capillaripes]|nr:hypothetical protein B0H19DRAFT_1072922 [Mycena capillaripes]